MRLLAAVFALWFVACATRSDPSAGRPYPCEPEGPPEQCPGGWVCGLERRCRDPNAPGDYLCLSDSDCAGWHCGPVEVGSRELRCYDRENPDAGAQPRPCRRELDGDPLLRDCAPQWRCGLGETCHPVGLAAAYPCASDTDCEADWRCSPFEPRVCIDTSAEALRAISPAGLLVRELVHPTFVPELSPNLFAATAHPAGTVDVATVAFVSDGGAYAMQSTVMLRIAFVRAFRRLEPTGAPRALAAYLDQVFFLDGAGLSRAAIRPDAGAPERIDPVSGAQALRVLLGRTQASPGEILVGAADRIWLGSTSPDASFAVAKGPYDGGAALRDWNGLNETGEDEHHLLALSSEGVFVAPRGPGGFVDYDGGNGGPAWRRLHLAALPHQGCGAVPSRGQLSALEVEELGQSFAVIEQPRISSDPTRIHLLRRATFGELVGADCSALGFELEATYEACAPGEGLDWLKINTLWPSTYLVSQCARSGDAGVELRERDVADGGLRILGRERVEPARSQPALAGLLTSSGRLGVYCGDLENCTSPWPLGAPAWISGSSRRRLVVSGDPLSSPFLYSYAPGAEGLAMRSDVYQSCGGVVGEPDLLTFGYSGITVGSLSGIGLAPTSAALSASRFATPKPRVLLAGSGDLVRELKCSFPGATGFVPVLARVARAPGGGRLLVVAARDRLWGISEQELGGSADGGMVRAFVKASAPAGSLALSMALLDSGADGGVLTGYLANQTSLARFTAVSSIAWRTELFEPPPEEVPLAVLADGDRAFLGTPSGKIYSLPSRVQLSPPLPSTAQAFEELCHATYALGSDGLYRLEPAAGSGMGSWVKVSLPRVPGADPATRFSGGRLHGDDGELLVFGPSGWVWRVRDPACQ